MKLPAFILVCAIILALSSYPTLQVSQITRKFDVILKSFSVPPLNNVFYTQRFEGLVSETDIAAEMSVTRTIAKAFKAIEKSEGAGAKVRRSVGTQQLRNFSPFLMLDHFSVGVGAGFPDHPHRVSNSKLEKCAQWLTFI
jgi:hypothetical protein